MEPVVTSTYVLNCIVTIIVVVAGIFAPRIREDGLYVHLASWQIVDTHCRTFGWSIFLGGLGMLYSALTGWDGKFPFASVQLTLFGVFYFVGLQVMIYEEELYRRRCLAVYHRYCQGLLDFFGERDENNRRKKPDLEFMKKVEQHGAGTLLPEMVIATRIRYARCHLGLSTECAGFACMIANYVRAGGLP